MDDDGEVKDYWEMKENCPVVDEEKPTWSSNEMVDDDFSLTDLATQVMTSLQSNFTGNISANIL